MSNPVRMPTPEERKDLESTLSESESRSVLIHGEGKERSISFYADETRRETHRPYPDED